MSNRATSTTAKPPLYKIVMLGDSGVGKTSLVARLTNPTAPLNHDISATMGIEFDTQMLDTTHGKVKAQIWDTAGQERFARVLLPTYFRKAKGVILVYDVTCGKSFESLTERWMAQLEDHANGNEMAKLLVGNKSSTTPTPTMMMPPLLIYTTAGSGGSSNIRMRERSIATVRSNSAHVTIWNIWKRPRRMGITY